MKAAFSLRHVTAAVAALLLHGVLTKLDLHAAFGEFCEDVAIWIRGLGT